MNDSTPKKRSQGARRRVRDRQAATGSTYREALTPRPAVATAPAPLRIVVAYPDTTYVHVHVEPVAADQACTHCYGTGVHTGSVIFGGHTTDNTMEAKLPVCGACLGCGRADCNPAKPCTVATVADCHTCKGRGWMRSDHGDPHEWDDEGPGDDADDEAWEEYEAEHVDPRREPGQTITYRSACHRCVIEARTTWDPVEPVGRPRATVTPEQAAAYVASATKARRAWLEHLSEFFAEHPTGQYNGTY